MSFAFLISLQVPVLKPMELMVEASPRRIFANAHTYHINSISVNSDGETYLSADDLRINLWHMEITDQSFNIVDIKPANMEELTEVRVADSCPKLTGDNMSSLHVRFPRHHTRTLTFLAGDHCQRVPSARMQPLRLLLEQGNHPPLRHAASRAL